MRLCLKLLVVMGMALLAVSIQIHVMVLAAMQNTQVHVFMAP